MSLKAKVVPIQYKNRNSKKGPDCRWPLQLWRLTPRVPCQHEEKRGAKEEKRLDGGFGTSEARPKLKARREMETVKISGRRGLGGYDTILFFTTGLPQPGEELNILVICQNWRLRK